MEPGRVQNRPPKRINKSLTNQIALGAFEFLLLVLRTASAHGLNHIAARKRHPLEMYQNTAQDETAGLLLLANATFHTFDKVEGLKNLSPNHYQDIIFGAAFNFTYSVSNSNSEASDLLPMITEFGICYTYNSQIAAYNSPSYWKENKWKLFPLVDVFKGNPLEGDIFVAMMEMNSDLQVFIHSPQEIPESASKWFLSAQKHYLALEFEALTIYSTENTRGLSVKQRKCRFLEESNLETNPVYSYNLCRSECRMRLGFKLCGCVPYFYRNIGKYRICDIAGMHCLSKYKERLIKLRDSKGNKQKCHCYPTCNEINYVIQTDSSIEWLLGTNFKYTLIKYPRSRLKRDIVFGASDLLVQFGGTVGLCLGCSLLSIVEIFYFLTLRLLLFIMAKGNL
nr:pickpocket protein 11-like [Halyomorpha halys]